MAGAEDMADRAYIRLGHRSENQAILFLCVYPPYWIIPAVVLFRELVC